MDLIIDRVIALKKAAIFKDMPDHLIAEIAKIVEIVEYLKGEKFIDKGTIGDEMFIIQKGEVRVHVGDKTLAVLGANQIVGELALLAPINRTADVSARTNVLLFKINREYFLELVYNEPIITRAIFQVLVSRIISLNEQLRKSEHHM